MRARPGASVAASVEQGGDSSADRRRERYPVPTGIGEVLVVARQMHQIERELLAQQDVREMPGWETRLYLIEYPPGVAASRHAHPVVGIGYVLEGRLFSCTRFARFV